MKLKPSRTLTATRLGLVSILTLAMLPLVALFLCRECMSDIVEVTSTLAMCIATVATGGTLSLGGRHWGSNEKSSFRASESTEENA